MNADQLKTRIAQIKDGAEAGTRPEEQHQLALILVGLELLEGFLIDIKRIADAAEERTRLAGGDPRRF